MLLSVAIRYPLVEHERSQTDSYFIHALSDSIVTNGYACWVFHPLSVVGYYPFSYPSGTPFLIAELSELTGLGVEAAILLYDMVIGCLFCLAVFGLVRLFISRSEYVMLAVLLTILGSRFVDTTYWDGSARGLFVAMSTLLIFSAFLSATTRRPILYWLTITFGLGCLFIHHMAVLLMCFAVAYLIAIFQVQLVVPWLRKEKDNRAVSDYAISILLLYAISFAALYFFIDIAALSLSDRSLFKFEPKAFAILLNTAVSYTNQIGFILPIAVIGVPVVLVKYRVSVMTLFPVTLLIVIIPILGYSLYLSMFTAPFVAILGVMWLIKFGEDGGRRRKIKNLMILALIVSSLILPVWSMQRWNQETHLAGGTVEVDCQVFNDATYMTHVWGGQHVISNTNPMTMQLTAVSSASLFGPGMLAPLSGVVTAENIRGNITLSTAPFPTNLYKWFVYENEPMVSQYVRNLMVRGLDHVSELGQNSVVSEYLLSGNSIWIAVDNNQPSKFVDSYSAQEAKFIDQLRSATWVTIDLNGVTAISLSSHMIFESEGMSLFILRYPA